jgi:hypothetical protein
MPKVGVTTAAEHFNTYHPVTLVTFFSDRFIVDRLEVTGPTCAGVELGIRVEQRGSAADAAVDAVAFIIIELPAERGFGAVFTADVVGFGREFLTPLLFGFGDFFHTYSLV